MKTDEEIQKDVAAITPVLGPTYAEWYADACHLEYGASTGVLIWACRTRDVIRTATRDLGGLVEAVEKLINACGRLDEGGGERVCEAVSEVEKAIWWKDK